MRTISALSVAALCLAPSVVRADDTPPAFRVGGGIGAFAWSAATSSGGGARAESDTYAIGLLTPMLALDLGALVTPWLAVGVTGQGSYLYSVETVSLQLGLELLGWVD